MCQSARTLRVFGEVVAIEREQQARAAWYAHAEQSIMDLLRASLLQRARELRELGANIEISEASSPPHVSTTRWGRSLLVRYRTSEVMAYSARTSNSLSVHWAWVIKSRRARSARLLSVPGFTVLCRMNHEPVMQEVGPFTSGAPVELGQLAWRLLEMLGSAARAQRTL